MKFAILIYALVIGVLAAGFYFVANRDGVIEPAERFSAALLFIALTGILALFAYILIGKILIEET